MRPRDGILIAGIFFHDAVTDFEAKKEIIGGVKKY